MLFECIYCEVFRSKYCNYFADQIEKKIACFEYFFGTVSINTC